MRNIPEKKIPPNKIKINVVLGCFAALGLRCLAVIKEILNSCRMIMILNRLMDSQIAEDKNLKFWKAKANWFVDK